MDDYKLNTTSVSDRIATLWGLIWLGSCLVAPFSVVWWVFLCIGLWAIIGAAVLVMQVGASKSMLARIFFFPALVLLGIHR